MAAAFLCYSSAPPDSLRLPSGTSAIIVAVLICSLYFGGRRYYDTSRRLRNIR